MTSAIVAEDEQVERGALMTSDTPRPVTTADGAIGIERKRSVTPRSLSIDDH